MASTKLPDGRFRHGLARKKVGIGKAVACRTPKWALSVSIMERKIGTIVYASGRGWWLLRVGPDSSLEIYFLHGKFIRSGKSITVGSMIAFDPGESRKPGDRPEARNADVLEPDVAEVLHSLSDGSAQ
jgi:hypothetical protein